MAAKNYGMQMLTITNHILTVTIIIISLAALATSIGLPGCKTKCGSLDIPYPYGLTQNCSLNFKFLINCTTNSTPILHGNIIVQDISIVDQELRILSPVAKRCYANGKFDDSPNNKYFLELNYLAISSSKNKLTVIGCDSYSQLYGSDGAGYKIGCSSECSRVESVVLNDGTCSGVGCCQLNIPKQLTSVELGIYSYNDHNKTGAFNNCSYAFIVEESKFKFRSDYLRDFPDQMVPVVGEWSVENNTCFDLTPFCPCGSNGVRQDIQGRKRFVCRCKRGYAGNPYLPNSCFDVNECQNLTLSNCIRGEECVNTEGSYFCKKKKKDPQILLKVIIALSSAFGAFLLLLVGWGFYKIIKKRIDVQRKEKFFKRNGGLLLQQQLSSEEVNVDRIKLFGSEELEKATDHFNVNRILGQGGQGTVYKGMLADGKIVAVKKSKLDSNEEGTISESKLSEFINEVVILSQINHRNVVKLLGCCLESEVPLLVYEFILNGTLYQYIHDHQNEEFPLTWEVRLRIALEIGRALSYLHSAASFPIYHRDIKSSNILLDEKYRAKIADFGTSRSVNIEQTHLTTLVKGTFGYLDPEYFQSSQFTEKSDVYSFGVVMVELLTGQKPISRTRSEQGEESRSLATYFILCMEQNRLCDIIDSRIISDDGSQNQIIKVAHLAKRCLNLNGKYRPTMTEVAMELEEIQKCSKTYVNMQSFIQHVGNEETESLWDANSTSVWSSSFSATASSLDALPLLKN